MVPCPTSDRSRLLPQLPSTTRRCCCEAAKQTPQLPRLNFSSMRVEAKADGLRVVQAQKSIPTYLYRKEKGFAIQKNSSSNNRTADAGPEHTEPSQSDIYMDAKCGRIAATVSRAPVNRQTLDISTCQPPTPPVRTKGERASRVVRRRCCLLCHIWPRQCRQGSAYTAVSCLQSSGTIPGLPMNTRSRHY